VARHLDWGRAAEELAARHLEQQGLAVVARNFRARCGELDVVCSLGNLLVVVEVRARSRPDRGRPGATLTPVKLRRVVRATQLFMRRFPRFAQHSVRFDVIEVTGDELQPQLRWLPAAFTLDDVARR
jgi:putative endonuclease